MSNTQGKLGVIDVSRRLSPVKSIPNFPVPVQRVTNIQDIESTRAFQANEYVESDPFNILILNYTMTCPLACDYCCYKCGPKRSETMNLDFALNLVDQAAALGVFAECGFTGGEPLVYYDDIIALTTRMAGYGLPFSMISACDWATDSATAAAKLQPLIDRGMSVFTASYDPSHERFVPRANVERAIDYVLSRGVRAVLCGSFYDDKTNLHDLFPAYAANSEVSLVTRVVLPKVGRSEKRDIQPSYYANTDTSPGGACYKRFYHDVTVFWDGEIYPCCSVYNRATPGISYGNAYDEPLAAIWDRIAGSLFLKQIKQGGFDGLYAFVEDRNPALASRLPDRAKAIGPCHLCNLLMGEETLARDVHELFAQEERDRVRNLLQAVRTQRGDDVADTLIREVLTT